MSKATLYNYSITGTSVIDELYHDVGTSTFQLGTGKRAFSASDFSISPGDDPSNYLVEGVDYELVDEDFNYTEECGFAVYTGVRILNSDYQTGDLYISYTCIGSYTDVSSILAAVESAGSRVGQLLITKEKITISASNPWWNLANPTQALSATTYPDYAPYLRALKAETKWASTYETTGTTSGSPRTTLTLAASKTWSAGQIIFLAGQFRMIVSGSGTSYAIDEPITISSGKIWSISLASGVSNFPITDYSRTSGTVSLFANSDTAFPELYIMLMNLAEDYFQDRSYRTLTLPADIGSSGGLVPAGDYQILSVTPANVGTSSAVITFTYAGSDVTLTALTSKYLNFYPHRIAGSANAMHYRIGDMAIMNDGLYNIAGYRTRDYAQGHRQTSLTASNFWGSGPGVGIYATGAERFVVDNTTGGMVTDNINESPRTGPRTKPRASIYNYYEYVGEVVS